MPIPRVNYPKVLGKRDPKTGEFVPKRIPWWDSTEEGQEAAAYYSRVETRAWNAAEARNVAAAKRRDGGA